MSPKVTMVLRVLLGLMCVIFGLNKFLHFIPIPPVDGDGGTLMGIWISSGFMTIIAILEILGGVALLLGRYVPLALTIITAIMFNAFLFHAMHDMGGIGGSAVGMLLSLALVYAYKDRFSSILSA